MGMISKLLARTCEATGSFNAGLVCNGLSTAVMTMIDKGGIYAGLTAMSLTGPTAVGAAVVLVALGGTAVIKAVCNAGKQKELEDRLKAIDTRNKSLVESVLAIREAIESTGVRLHAEELIDLRSIVDAAKHQDLTKLDNESAERIIAAIEEAGLATAEHLKEIEQFTKETWLRSIHIWEEQRANSTWLRDLEARLNTKLDAIAADAKSAATNTNDLKVGQAEELAILRRVEAMLAAQSAAKPTPARTATGITNIPAPDPHWIHRRAITRAIRAMLNSEGGTASLTAAVATAAGGYGKTFAARLYAHEHAADYPGGRFEIKVETSDFALQLGLLLDLLSPGHTLQPREAAPHVRDILAKEPASLLIIDNVPSLDAWNQCVASGLVPGGHCHVLLTTQKKDVLADRAVRVPKFTNEEAWTVIAQARTDALDTENVFGVGRVLRAADGLPVVVAAVAARMRATPEVTWEAYWTALTAKHPVLFADSALPALIRPADAPPDANQSARHHALLDDCYDNLPAATQRVLDYAALLPQDMAPRPWLETLLTADATCVPPQTGAAVVAEAVADQLLTSAGEEGKLLSLHRLWHARLNARAEAAKYDRTQLLLAIAACAAARRVDVLGVDEPGKVAAINDPHVLTNAALRWELSPLISVALALAQAGRLKEAVTVAWWLPSPLRLLGRLAEARAVLESLLKDPAAAQAALGGSDFASLLGSHAVIKRNQGDLPGARASIERAIKVEQAQERPRLPDLAAMYSNLAMIQLDQHDPPGARASMKRAIAIQGTHLALDHPTFATSYSNLAMIQNNQQDLPGARASMERAIAIQEKHFAADHPIFATSYSNLATIQYTQGDFPNARASMDRAIAIEAKHFSPDHFHLAISYSNLAVIQKAQGDLPGARASMERAIAIEEKSLGAEHPSLATMHSNLAMIQQDQGDLPGARASMERAIAIKLKHVDADHPNFAISYSNLAQIAVAEGKIPAAMALLRQAHAICLKALGPDHPWTKNVADALRHYDPPGP